MSLTGEITAKLKATAALTALVPAVRIMQEHQPQATPYPQITMTLAGVDHGHDVSGSAGYADTTLLINVWARKVSDRDAIGEQVRLALQGFSGLLTTIYTAGIVLEEDDTFFEPDSFGGQDGWFHRIMTFFVMAGEAIPA